MRIVSEDLLVAVSQYMTTDLTRHLIMSLKADGVPFKTLILFDGTPENRVEWVEDLADIKIFIPRTNSLPEIWNLMFACAKASGAKYLLWSGSDMLYKKGSLSSMMGLIKEFDVVSPVKIDADEEKFLKYQPISDKPIPVIGFNDSTALFRMNSLFVFPFEEDYGPYQFETSALAFQMYIRGRRFVIDPKAVVLHYCSKDIAFSPETRKDSENWDKKKELFIKKEGFTGRWFIDNVIMNFEAARKYGFPVREI